jgi:hypothetical protein
VRVALYSLAVMPLTAGAAQMSAFDIEAEILLIRSLQLVTLNAGWGLSWAGSCSCA